MSAPPKSSSTVIPCSPSAPSSSHRSRGNSLVASISLARGAILDCANRWTVSLSASISSPRAKLIPELNIAVSVGRVWLGG